MGEKTITFKLRELSQSMDKVRAKLESGEDLEEGFMEMVEAALDTADQLRESAVIRLDQLATEKDENKALILSRPKMAFEVFRGDFSQFATFKANQERIYEMFYARQPQIRAISTIVSTQQVTVARTGQICPIIQRL